jgi:hypothetical protein
MIDGAVSGRVGGARLGLTILYKVTFQQSCIRSARA